MSRLLLGAAAVVLLPTTLFAQLPASVASGMGNFGPTPGNRPQTPALAAPIGSPFLRPGGFVSPFYFNRGIAGGFGGGYVYSPFIDQFYAPYTAYANGFVPFAGAPGTTIIEEPIGVEPTPTRVVELSNEFPATVTMEFPAAAKVWLDGKPVEGETGKERVLTSPVLKPGQQ